MCVCGVWARICVICVQLGVVVQVGPELVGIIPCLSMELFSRCVNPSEMR